MAARRAEVPAPLWQSAGMVELQGDGPGTSGAAGGDIRPPREVGRRPGDIARTVGVALLPLILLGGSLLGGLIEDNRGTMIGDVLVTWNLVGVFGALVFLPVVVVSLVGAGVLAWQFRFGRWLASIGSAAMVLLASALVYGMVADVVDPPEWRDPYSWAPPLTPLTVTIFVAPFLAIAAANVYVVLRLWKRAS